MNLGQSSGGLPPDEVVEDTDAILAASEAAIAAHHDPSFDSMLRIGLAPCSPFSVPVSWPGGTAYGCTPGPGAGRRR